MVGYIIKRLLLVIPTLFLVSVMVFFIIRVIPGDIVDMVPPPMVRLGDIRALPSPGEAAGTYTVMPGDSLWRIAARHLEATTGTKPTSAKIDRFWRRIYAENAELIGADPDLIFPGQRLRIPTGGDDGT